MINGLVDTRRIRFAGFGLESDQIRAMFGMKGGMHHLVDHQRSAETAGASIDGGTAFGLGQTFASAFDGHLQKAGVLEFAKHCRDLLAAHLSQVSHKELNVVLWQNNGDVSHA